MANVVEARAPATITPERFESEFVRAGEPRVLRGFVSGWPARKWTFPEIGPHLPDRPLRATGPDEYGLTARGHELLRDQVSTLLASAVPRDTRVDWLFDLLGELPELLSEMPPPNVSRGAIRYRLFVGRDTVSHGHYHSYQHAILCQVHGKKRVLLYPPRDIFVLYPEPLTADTHGIGSSAVDFRQPDLARFPKMSRSHPLEAVLEPGDALFIPIHWWHAVYGLGATVSVSLFWHARLREYSFPQPGIRALSSYFRWNTLPKLRDAAVTAGRRFIGVRSGRPGARFAESPKGA